MESILKVLLNDRSLDHLLTKEWLVTNGLGSYASGTIVNVNTRRHHGIFVPNLPAPRGRTLLMPALEETILTGHQQGFISGFEFADRRITGDAHTLLKEFKLHLNIPIWTFEIADHILEKRIWMPYGQNTVCITYKLLKGQPIQLKLRPFSACRKQDGSLGYASDWPFNVSVDEHQYEISAFDGAPPVRITAQPFKGQFIKEAHLINDVFYRLEHQRGLDCIENAFSAGYFIFDLKENDEITWIVSSEEWKDIDRDIKSTYLSEVNRLKKLIEGAHDELTAQLTLAADQFIILPKTRNENLQHEGISNQARTIIAGYHWFTDWGRDTMISLEGLTLCTGRHSEAKTILTTFSKYVHNGLLPNHFPEGERTAIYNTVDATFWYFHAIDRYLTWTKDKVFLKKIFPVLESIIAHHIKGADFGIHMDPVDSLISAAAQGYQLTWMDAKVDEWVVTPRRGKPVEIQALWFNALKLMEEWAELLDKPSLNYSQLAQKVQTSFNNKYIFKEKGYLYDVIDTTKGADDSFRPNQIFAIALKYPILNKDHWRSVVDLVKERLLTPYGLRTLESSNKEYHSRYEGSRWNRDAAYHQGLVWAWLIGPFLDAWYKVYENPKQAKEFLAGFKGHLQEGGMGSISEIFDAEDPFIARGCIAQAWSVAEVLRCWQRINQMR